MYREVAKLILYRDLGEDSILLKLSGIFEDFEAVTLAPFFAKLAHSGLEIYLHKIKLDLPVGTMVRLSDEGGFFAIGEVRLFDDGLAIKPIRQFGKL